MRVAVVRVAVEARSGGERVWDFPVKLGSLAAVMLVFAVWSGVDWFEGGGLGVGV